MDKFCVFCGDIPKNKNKEHIIPQWLIEFTGDPNRSVDFGPIWNSKTSKLELKKFAFDQFQFPACEKCNQEHSALEVKAKAVLKNLIAENPLSSKDLNILLDWLDKIRVGLWLAYNYLQTNLSAVEPNYHISKRIGVKDRIVFIYKSDYKNSGINFSGTNTPAFQYLPTCFSLRINQFVFFNVSTDFLISQKLGFPFATEVFFTETQALEFALNDGKKHQSYPLIDVTYDNKCTEIYQPIFSYQREDQGVSYLYDNTYVKSLSEDFKKGIGKILFTENHQFKEYPSEPSTLWIPQYTWNIKELLNLIGKQVLNSQIFFINQKVSFSKVSAEKKNLIKFQHEFAKRINKLFLNSMEDK